MRPLLTLLWPNSIPGSWSCPHVHLACPCSSAGAVPAPCPALLCQEEALEQTAWSLVLRPPWMAWAAAEGKELHRGSKGCPLFSVTLGWALTVTGLSVLKGIGMVTEHSGE